MSSIESEVSERVLCTPDGIRVWRGYRSTNFVDKRDDFDKHIASVFIPHTAQQMFPLGLQSYFPALLPDSRLKTIDTGGRNDAFLILPDEIALVVYPSKCVYKHAVSASVAGRAYSMLHWPMFSSGEPPIPKSLSGNPVAWKSDWNFDEPFTLVDDAIDWQTGVTEVIVLQRNFRQSDQEYRLAINESVAQWLNAEHTQIDGSILAVNKHYLLYWEHRQTNNETQSLIASLKQFMGPAYMQKIANPVYVPPAFTNNDNGVNLSIGDVLDVRLRRLA